MASATHPKVKKEFAEALRPLSDSERERLEASILKNGVRDPVDVWGGWVADGHNRLAIAKAHKLPYQTRVLLKADFPNEESVIHWIVTTQLARRNLSVTQMKYYAGKLVLTVPSQQETGAVDTEKKGKTAKTAEVAEQLGVSQSAVAIYTKQAGQVDSLAKPLADAYKDGKLKLTAPQLAALSQLSKTKQIALATKVKGGGKWGVLLGLDKPQSKAKKAPATPKPIIGPQVVVDCFKSLVKHVDAFHDAYPNEDAKDSIQATLNIAYEEFETWVSKT